MMWVEAVAFFDVYTRLWLRPKGSGGRQERESVGATSSSHWNITQSRCQILGTVISIPRGLPGEEEEVGTFGSRRTLVQILPVSPTSCATQGKLSNFSASWYLHGISMKNGDYNILSKRTFGRLKHSDAKP